MRVLWFIENKLPTFSFWHLVVAFGWKDENGDYGMRYEEGISVMCGWLTSTWLTGTKRETLVSTKMTSLLSVQHSQAQTKKNEMLFTWTYVGMWDPRRIQLYSVESIHVGSALAPGTKHCIYDICLNIDVETGRALDFLAIWTATEIHLKLVRFDVRL